MPCTWYPVDFKELWILTIYTTRSYFLWLDTNPYVLKFWYITLHIYLSPSLAENTCLCLWRFTRRHTVTKITAIAMNSTTAKAPPTMVRVLSVPAAVSVDGEGVSLHSGSTNESIAIGKHEASSSNLKPWTRIDAVPELIHSSTMAKTAKLVLEAVPLIFAR